MSRRRAVVVAATGVAGIVLVAAAATLGAFLWTRGGESTPEDAAVRAALRSRTISVNLRGDSLSSALDVVAEAAGANIVVTPAARLEAQGRTIDRTSGTPETAIAAIDAIVARAGVRWEIEHGMVWVCHPNEVVGSRVDLRDADAALRAALASRKVTLNFDACPVEDVAQFLHDILGVSITEDVAGDAAVGLRLRDVTLESALEAIASQLLDVRWVAHGGAIVLEVVPEDDERR